MGLKLALKTTEEIVSAKKEITGNFKKFLIEYMNITDNVIFNDQ